MIRGLTAVVLLLTAQTAEAQIRGTVVTTAGMPIADAVVDLWSAMERLDRTVTRMDGRFDFTARSGQRVVVRAIGFESRGVDVSGSTDAMIVRLRERVPELETIEVRGSKCGRREEAEARRKWVRAASMYSWSSPPGRQMLTSRARTDARVLPDSLFGMVPFDSSSYGSFGTTKYAVDNWSGLRRASGYPVSSAGDPSGDLGGNYAGHLTSHEFGALHRFHLTSDSAAIRFCPRAAEGSWIEGVIHFAPSGSFERVEWSYTVARSWVGGSAGFAPPDGMTLWPLRPTWAVRWERLSGGMRRVIMTEYRGWCWETPTGSHRQ